MTSGIMYVPVEATERMKTKIVPHTNVPACFSFVLCLYCLLGMFGGWGGKVRQWAKQTLPSRTLRLMQLIPLPLRLGTWKHSASIHGTFGLGNKG